MSNEVVRSTVLVVMLVGMYVECYSIGIRETNHVLPHQIWSSTMVAPSPNRPIKATTLARGRRAVPGPSPSSLHNDASSPPAPLPLPDCLCRVDGSQSATDQRPIHLRPHYCPKSSSKPI